MAKPKHLKRLTVLMCVLNLTGYLFLSGKENTKLIELIIITLLIGFYYWVLFKFYQGFNWARIVVMITSGIALLNLLLLEKYYYYTQAVILTDAILATYLLYWLNAPNVKEYFLQKNKQVK